MSESDYKLTIATTSKEAGLPSEEVVLAAGRALIDSVTSWKRGKAFSHGTVQTYSKAKGSGDGASWHCRISEHGPEDATFDELWKYLGVEHAEHESQYIKDVKRATLIKELAPNRSIWSMYYEFPTFGVSSRVFTALQISTIEGNAGKRIGFFIQIPVDLSDQPDLAAKEGKGVKGKYVSVERFKELENGKVEWRMATSSSPGGSIPSFLVEGTMDSQIAADVPHFLKWLHKLRNEGATDTGENGAIRGQSSTATADIAPEIVTNPEVDAMKTTIAAPTGTMPPMAA